MITIYRILSVAAVLTIMFLCHGAAPRQRLARSLSSDQVVSAVTNAPAGARLSVPEHGALRRQWAAQADWHPGDITILSNATYVCIQGHRSQPDWSSDHVPALWRLVRAADTLPGEIPLWVQPQGAHDAYAKGARVRRGGHIWVSTISDNVWAPGVYGWRRVKHPIDLRH